MRYRADITAGSLKVPESRIIADLLLSGVDGAGWDKAVLDQNVLQARMTESAKRILRDNADDNRERQGFLEVAKTRIKLGML